MIALPPYDARTCRLYALGRNAMYAACEAFGLQAGDEILTPAFDCDGTLQPFRVRRHQVQFYRSDPHTFAVDVEDIARRITPRTKLVHVIHHFGLPQPWEALHRLAQERQLPILEDNAYSLFSVDAGRPFGTFGDAAIFSLRKNLPLMDGGLLRINNPQYHAPAASATRRLFPRNMRTIVSFMKDRFGYRALPDAWRQRIRRTWQVPMPPPPLYSSPERGVPTWPARDSIDPEFSCDYLRPMSRVALQQLASITAVDVADMAVKKRNAYMWLVSQLSHIEGVHVLWPALPEGIVPWSVNCLIAEGRDELLERLQGRYPVLAWPTLPQAVIDQLDDFPEVELLGRQLLQLTLPVPDVRSPAFQQQMRNMVAEIRDVLSVPLVGVG